MPLDELSRGAKVPVHLALYEREVAVLDKLCIKYDCSRPTVIGELLMEYSKGEAMQDAVFENTKGRRARKSSL